MRRLRGESGAAMAFALAFLTLFGLLVASVLGFSETGLRASNALAGEGDELAAASGAIEGAINRARGDLAVGAEGFDADCFEPPAINGVGVVVRCEGQSGSGAATGGSGGGATDGEVPPYALWALGAGSGGEAGIRKLDEKSTVGTTGSIYSRARITATGTLSVVGSVSSQGNCTGSIVTGQPPLRCANTGGGADPAGATDPLYPPDQSSQPANRSVPSCGSGWLVTLLPGRYTDAEELTELFDDCDNKVFHFTPGFYFFRFANGEPLWEIDDPDVTIIGGTPLGWSTSASSKPSIDVPGGCDPTAPGVQFLFGRRSQLRFKGGRMELCPQPHEDAQRIAIYGAGPAAPGFNVQNGCVAQTPYPDSGCAFLRVEGQETTFVSHGTIYAPLAAVDVLAQDGAHVEFRRGIVARTIVVEAKEAWTQTGAFASLPAGGSAAGGATADRVIRFTARIAGIARVRALVTIHDDGGADPGLDITIEEWSVL